MSILKPVRGLDPDAYENFASFCCQDYPEYEVVFCVGDHSDPVLPIIEKVIADFPERSIRVLFGSGREATNDKVAKLARLAKEARYEILVINDSDVRAEPEYLRTVVAPLADPKVGAVTCFYVPTDEKTLVQKLQTTGMYSDFYPGIVVAWQLDGVKFALGPTIATSRARLAGFGGYEAIENRPADDLLVGRLIAEQGYEVKLTPVYDSDGGGLSIPTRPVPQAPALDRGDAAHAAVGTPGLGLYAGIAMVIGRDRNLADAGCGRSLPRGLSRPARCHDVADCLVGAQATSTMAGFGAYSCLGRDGRLNLAGKLYPQHDSLARSRLLHSEWRTGTGGR